MKPGLSTGLTGRLEWAVEPEHTITLGDRPEATVFSTPSMIMLMERTARFSVRPFLEDGEETVGARVDIEHLGGAPLGALVRGESRLVKRDGRRLDFEVAAYHGERLLGRGQHTRVVVSLDKLVQKLASDSGSGPDAPRAEAVLPAFRTMQWSVEGAVGRLVLDRPRARNAVNREMTGELERLSAWLAAPGCPVRVVQVRGAEGAFCAGDDVKEVEGLSLGEARDLSLRQARLYLGLERLPQVWLALIDGPALGAGCVFAGACDIRLATHAAVFGMPEIRLGWAPGYGVAQLTALVGKARALQMCLTGETIRAREALEWGLVHELMPGGRLKARAADWTARLLAHSPAALAEVKRLVHADEGPGPKLTHLRDTEAYLRGLAGPDAREGMRAFREKRPPRFPGAGN